MSDYSKTCICCGEHYFGRGKDSLCKNCDGSGFRQQRFGFNFEQTDSSFYEWKPTEAYKKAKGYPKK